MTGPAPLERTITQTDMVAYAGATWDWHPLHYDAAHVADAGLPGTVVDGQVFGALMAEQLLDHFGPRAFVSKLSFRFKTMVFAGETVRVLAEVTAEAAGVVLVSQRVMVDERVAVDGKAEVRVG